MLNGGANCKQLNSVCLKLRFAHKNLYENNNLLAEKTLK